MQINFIINNSDKYYSISSEEKRLTITSTSDKGKATNPKIILTAIEEILVKFKCNDQISLKLNSVAQIIASQFLEKHTEHWSQWFTCQKVASCAALIHHLTTVPSLPLDIFFALIPFLDMNSLAQLGAINKEIGGLVQREWPFRAQQLGWESSGKGVCILFRKSLTSLGCGQFFSMLAPSKEVLFKVIRAGHFDNYLPPLQEDAFIRFLGSETKWGVNDRSWSTIRDYLKNHSCKKEQLFSLIDKCFRRITRVDPNWALICVKIIIHLGATPGLDHLIEHADVDFICAQNILQLLPANAKEIVSPNGETPLERATRLGHAGWQKALEASSL